MAAPDRRLQELANSRNKTNGSVRWVIGQDNACVSGVIVPLPLLDLLLLLQVALLPLLGSALPVPGNERRDSCSFKLSHEQCLCWANVTAPRAEVPDGPEIRIRPFVVYIGMMT